MKLLEAALDHEQIKGEVVYWNVNPNVIESIRRKKTSGIVPVQDVRKDPDGKAKCDRIGLPSSGLVRFPA